MMAMSWIEKRKPTPTADTMELGMNIAKSKKNGLAGNRTPDHSHAKGVLYH
jgi:hypothetical protein